MSQQANRKTAQYVNSQGVFRNTSSVQVESLLDMNQAIEQEKARSMEDQSGRIMTAAVSHELRAPLTSVIGFTELLLNEVYGSLNSEQKNIISKIDRNAKRMLAMINGLLELARLDSERLPVHLSRIDLRALIEETVGSITPFASAKNLTISSEIAENLPHIETDEQKLFQILVNLLSNAVKYTSKGSVSISADTANGEVAITVSDTGIGIRRTDFDKIFEEFVQLGGRGSSKRGVGLGLAIAKRLVGLLEGSISVSSQPGKGSTFTVQLPVSPGRSKRFLEGQR